MKKKSASTDDYLARTAVLSYRIPKELKADLQSLADADHRKLAPYIQLLLANHVAKAKALKKR